MPAPRTRLVNIHVAACDVYIGRLGAVDGVGFGNPYVVGLRCGRCGEVHKTPGATIPCFTRYFHERIETDALFRIAIHGLLGKVLGCHCSPRPCHGAVIVEYLEKVRPSITLGET